jgi:hypothetical protein
VSEVNEPHDADYEEANSQLVTGLRNCRSMVENYRAMLSSEQEGPNAAAPGGDAELGESFE